MKDGYRILYEQRLYWDPIEVLAKDPVPFKKVPLKGI